MTPDLTFLILPPGQIQAECSEGHQRWSDSRAGESQAKPGEHQLGKTHARTHKPKQTLSQFLRSVDYLKRPGCSGKEADGVLVIDLNHTNFLFTTTTLKLSLQLLAEVRGF